MGPPSVFPPSCICPAVFPTTPPPPPPDEVHIYEYTRTPAQATERVFRLESCAQNSEQDRLLTASKYTRNCSARPRTGLCRPGASYPTGTTVLSNERLQNLSLGDHDGSPQHSGWLSPHLNALHHILLMNNIHLTLHMGEKGWKPFQVCAVFMALDIPVYFPGWNVFIY